MDNFILEIPNSLSKELCEEMIERFEKDDRKKPGVTLVGLTNHKKSVDLSFSGFAEWKDIDNKLYHKLTESLTTYISHLTKHVGDHTEFFDKTYDSGYQIQKTIEGEYYSWHHDQNVKTGRVLTFLWYLNTLDHAKDGGGTLFYGGKVITPEQGKLILFPATWTYQHMGLPVTGRKYKYICTGWLHLKTT
jgi:Rps23 Pro-64 3,4-dihydroxylase Tpa1-like proline 4-hydroxylase